MSKSERLIIIIGIMLAFILTISAAVFHGKGPFPEIPPKEVKWIWTALLGEVVGAVIFAFKSLFRKRNIEVYLKFERKKAIDIELDGDKCTYEVIKDNKTKDEGKIIPEWVFSGWRCPLPDTANDCDKVKLTLVDRDGKKWEVPHFRPTDVIQKASIVKNPNKDKK